MPLPSLPEPATCPSRGNMYPTSDLHVLETSPLLSSSALKEEIPTRPAAVERVFLAREAVRRIIHGEDARLLVVTGPCSIHDPSAAMDYARRLVTLAERHQDELLVVMRVYFEKPRTTVGWKGLINDPHLDGTYDIPQGLRLARRLLRDVVELGLPTATEMLDPIVPQYIADLVTWTAVGARTTESQTHREMASGLSMPVGFKNATDGGLEVAVNAILAAAKPHSFLGVDVEGRVSVVRTAGNPDGHLVLRGGSGGPNYGALAIGAAAEELARMGLYPRMVVDCSHDNSGKDHERQPEVLREIAEQVAGGARNVLGVMIESNLVAGKQSLQSSRAPVYGQSITDACVDFSTTERMLDDLATAVRQRGAR
jgi:3-deoxy-7-phosphoheptulonate synthase